MVVGSALEDARHLAQKYDRVRQEAESQVTTSLENVTCFNSGPTNSNFWFYDSKNIIRTTIFGLWLHQCNTAEKTSMFDFFSYLLSTQLGH